MPEPWPWPVQVFNDMDDQVLSLHLAPTSSEQELATLGVAELLCRMGYPSGPRRVPLMYSQASLQVLLTFLQPQGYNSALGQLRVC